MSKKLTGKELAKFEAERDVWQEVLDGVREIKAGGGKRTKVQLKSRLVRVRLSRRTLEQWEQGRRRPSGAAQTLLKIVERHPEVLIEVAE